jgi:mannose-6-phosphate isomerase-like protein (cupin superfamily)
MIKSIQNTEHYSWGEGCDAWHLLKSTGLSVIQERMAPGTSERTHSHQRAQQLFYILSGEATFELNAERLVVKTHEALHVPAGAKHVVANNTGEDLEFLVISQPPAQGDRQDHSV